MWLPEGPRLGLIDGDLLAYACCFRYNEPGEEQKAADAIDRELLSMRDFLELDDFVVYMQSGSNFRKALVPSYKAQRKESNKPRHIYSCYSHLAKEWKAQALRDYEADDLIGIAMTENPEALCMSFDKDLNQIPGWHYDWRKYHMYYVAPEDAPYFLVEQMLTGDTADNIEGIKGIGPKKAAKILDGQKDFALLMEKALAAYYEHGKSFKDFEQTYQCLKILRTPEIEWPELEEFRA